MRGIEHFGGIHKDFGALGFWLPEPGVKRRKFETAGNYFFNYNIKGHIVD